MDFHDESIAIGVRNVVNMTSKRDKPSIPTLYDTFSDEIHRTLLENCIPEIVESNLKYKTQDKIKVNILIASPVDLIATTRSLLNAKRRIPPTVGRKIVYVSNVDIT
jgi:hypothetical protein